MKLTCVTATFNCIKAGNRDLLIRCVESVAKLKTVHEHRIYDGASNDGTAELLRDLAAKIPGLKVVSEPDTGIYNALNKGVREAMGEWFYVLGADDYIIFPQVMDQLLLKYEFDQIVTPTMTDFDRREITINQIYLHTPYCHQGVIQKTEVIRMLGGFNDSYRIAGDYELFLKCHIAGIKITYINAVFAYYNTTGVSASHFAEMNDEFDAISATYFHSKKTSINKMRLRGHVTASLVIPYLFHCDTALRMAAIHAIGCNIKDCLRVLLWPLVIMRRMILK